MSEFGRGYATCLRQFTFHQNRLDRYLTAAEQWPPKDNGVWAWANGASDHLYELMRPRRGLSAAEWHRAKTLQNRALDIGHGWGESRHSTPDEARALLTEANALLDALRGRGHAVETLEDAMLTDQALGLHPEKGDWSCSEDISFS